MNDKTWSKESAPRSMVPMALGGVVVVVLSFSATLYALQWLGGPSPVSPGGMTTATPISSSATRSTVTLASTLSDIPTISVPDFKWSEILNLNAQVMSGTSILATQPILRLTSIPSTGRHYLGIEATALQKNQIYKIIAWVKPEAGANFMIEAGDHSPTRGSYGAGQFDLATHDMGGSGNPGSAPGPQDWQMLWINVPSSSGQLFFNFYVMKGGAIDYTGDGKVGIILGGFEVKPQT